MLVPLPQITKCSDCGSFFWLDERNEVEHSSEETQPSSRFLSIYEYQKFLSGSFHSNDDEMFIRNMIWWKMNDRVREGKALFKNPVDEKLWENNLIAIQSLINSFDQNEQITRAEINRNLGQFDGCRKLLETIKNPEMNWLVEAFEKQIEAKNTLVFVLG
jgi:hypothetical protein